MISAVAYFDQDAKAIDDFKVKLDILLTWSVTPLQYGDHRPFAAATLIQSWRNRACDRACRRDTGAPSEFLQDQLFDWLDTSDVAGEPSNIGNIALLYGKLVRHDIFSYPGYIQRLIARAEPGLDVRPLSTSVLTLILMIREF
jgi:mediator of RNA polymerase II transcription subunit 12